ncbi:MAG: helix-hairpin-helix domain-containing protein [Verrucomicrobia bacterium]|nr:helix-hairpin-helix domain-containing protein [Verrucomicrobiota bacterium]MDA1065158.1 helix-hairpin-helix domain-containing protein [Verrucomicrobiota bacterium]
MNPLLIQASDIELEEKLKAVMILFEKGKQGLQEEIDSLNLQVSDLEAHNQKLNEELDAEREKNLTLQTQLLIIHTEGSTSSLGSEVVSTETVAAITDSPATNPRGGARQGQRQRNGVTVEEPEEELVLDEEDLVDINSATKDELLSLPLVNDFLANNIINGRPWSSVEDLIQLQGFGPMKLRRLQPWVKVEPIEEIPEVEASENPVD